MLCSMKILAVCSRLAAATEPEQIGLARQVVHPLPSRDSLPARARAATGMQA